MKALLKEAAASARSQLVASILTVLVVAGMIVTVMMTTGRTVAAEQQVLSSIDDAGTRAIQVRADDAAGVTTAVLDRIHAIDGIEWAAAFSSAIDATNALIPDGTKVPVRYIYSDHLDQLGMDSPIRTQPTAFASETALAQLGLPDIGGAVALGTGTTAAIGGKIVVPDYLSSFEPVVFIPGDRTTPQTVNVLLVIAETPELVAPLADAVSSVLGAEDPRKVAIDTSESLAQLRGLIQSQLSSASRTLVLALLGLMSLLVAVIHYGLVMLRRKDFGRRRALGATRAYIVTILVTQTALLTLVGISFGALISTGVSLALRDPLPGTEFTLAVGILALAAAVGAAVVPAVVASRREPIRELRVP